MTVYRWPLIVGVSWLAMVVGLALAGPDVSICLVRNTTGVSCPSCGGTRALLALADGRLLDAVTWNPLVVLGLVAAAAWTIARVVAGRRLVPRLGPRGRAAALITMGVTLAANWIWVLARETIPVP